MRRFSWTLLAASILTLWAELAGAQLSPGTRITILTPEPDDSRLALASDAIDFWNVTFEELGLDPVLAQPTVVSDSPAFRLAENYARMIAQRVGRLRPGSLDPAPPPELTDIDSEVIVLLSRQKLMPFSWPLPRTGQTFIAISAPPAGKEVDPGVRNVVAHELGHALGLVHGRNPKALMCMPCRTFDDRGAGPAFSPLTSSDRSRLEQLYGEP